MNSSPIAGLTIIVAAICCHRAALSEPVSMSASAHALAIQDCAGCPSLVLVPPGRFAMGANAQDATLEGLAPQRAATEWPVHTVTIASAFYLGGTEVTRGQFAVFAHATVYRPSGPCSVYDRAQGSFVMSAVHDWRSAAIPQSENHPVVCIDWAAANAYVMWLTSRTGKHYRLPTEAEWEYAARAGVAASRYWGDDRGSACRYANVADRSWAQAFPQDAADVFPCSDRYPATAPVASFAPNAFGLFDMIGNVWEWTTDCFNQSYAGAPADGAAWATGDCTRRVARGGARLSTPRHVTSAFRDADMAAYRSSYLGFRVARDP